MSDPKDIKLPTPLMICNCNDISDPLLWYSCPIHPMEDEEDLDG